MLSSAHWRILFSAITLVASVSAQSETGRRASRRIGDSNVLVVHVTFSDSTVSLSAANLSDSFFGTIDDPVNLASQYAACSNNQLTFSPATGNNIIDGVVSVTINETISLKSFRFAQSLAETAAASVVGDISQFDHVVICLPRGSTHSSRDNQTLWTMETDYGGRTSVFNDYHCTYVLLQMQAIAGNMNLWRSYDSAGSMWPVAIGGGSGVMGVDLREQPSNTDLVDPDDMPVMCFNPAKSFELGWFADCVTTEITPAGGTFKHLVGQGDYTRGGCASDESEAVVIQVVTGNSSYADLFIGYNRASGSNVGTYKHADKVTLVFGWSLHPSQEVGALSEGQSQVVPSKNGDILVKFCSLTNNKATVVVVLNGTGEPCACTACDGSATCSSSEGAFTCSCNDGYAGSGVECSNVNECSTGAHNCDANAKCTETVGSYTCACNSGFSGVGYPTVAVPSSTWYGCDSLSSSGCGSDWHTYLGPNMSANGAYTWRLDMPFSFCGVNTTHGVHITTSSYITFGGAADNYHSQGDILGPNVPSLPTLFIGGADNAAMLIRGKYVFEEGPGPGYVVRFEGRDYYMVQPGESPNILWEATLFENGMIRVLTAEHDSKIGLFGLSDGIGNWQKMDRGAEHASYSYMFPGCNSSLAAANFGVMACKIENECIVGTDNCGDNAACSDTDGSFTCVCNSGWSSIDSGVTCTNMDECGSSANCDSNATCTDTDGSFTCTCDTGLGSANNGVTCTNMDECIVGTDNSCDDNAACSDTDGSFTCACNAGFTSTNSAVTCTAVTFNLTASATLEGMTLAAFDKDAEESFMAAVAKLMTGKTTADIVITSKTEVTRRRMLLAAGVKVDYQVGGFENEAQVTFAAGDIQEKSTELVTDLQQDSKFSTLTGISHDFGDLAIPDPIGSVGAGRSASWGVALLSVAACLKATA